MSENHEAECWHKVSDKYDPAYSQDFFHEGYIAGQSAPPTLPPVCPEDLVEGEWYVFNYHTAFIPMIGKAEIHQGKFRLVDSFNSSKWSWANSETDIYGPLKFKIGGAE